LALSPIGISGIEMLDGADMSAPPRYTRLIFGPQLQLLVFWICQVLIKACPGANSVSSGSVTSVISAASQPGVVVGCEPEGPMAATGVGSGGKVAVR
jgi:hypothetical protein